MKKKISIFVLIAVVALIGAVFYLKGNRYEVAITQEQIDKALVEKFPISKSYLFVFEITYSNPQVTLLAESNRIAVGMDAVINLKLGEGAKNLGGGCTVTAGLRYKPESHEFFLADAQFDRLEIQGMPEKHLDKVSEFASKFAQDYVEKFPVYTLEAKDSKTAAAKLLLKGIKIHDQAIHVMLGI